MTWEGEERRNGGKDHDLLIKIDANLSNFMRRFDNHVKDDTRQFDALFKRTTSLQKFMWFIGGGLLMIEFVIKVYFK